MNLNPSLVMGQALAWLDKQPEDRRPREHDRRYTTLRIYQPTGSGYWFVQQHSANRWYLKDTPDADHFCVADVDDIAAAIAGGARVQLTGVRGESFGIWNSWVEFEKGVSE